jgi:hypothetical protein
MRPAAEALARVYDAAARNLQIGVPSPRLTIGVLLQLQEGGHLELSETLRSAMQRWIDATGAEAKLLAGETGVIWRILGELSALGPELSLEVRGAIVLLACGTPWADVHERLLAHRRASLAAAERDAVLVEARRSLPAAAAIAAALRGENVATQNATRRRTRSPVGALFAVIAILISTASAGHSACNERAPEPPVVALPIEMPHAITGPRPALRAAMSLARAVAVEARRENAGAAIEGATREVSAALDDGDCARAVAAMRRLREAIWMDAGVSPRFTSNADALDLDVYQACVDAGADTAPAVQPGAE